MRKNTIKNYNAPSCTGFNDTKIHSQEPHTIEKISPLNWRLKSVMKSGEQLSRKSSGSGFRSPGGLIRNVLKGPLPGSGTDDIELNGVISTGKALYLEAQALNLTQRENPQQAPPLSLKTKTGLAMAATLILSGAETFFKQFSQPGRSDPHQGSNLNDGSVFSMAENTAGPADGLPSHTSPNEGAIPAHRHARRHLAAPQPLTTVLPPPEVSKKKLFDLSCVEERVKLSFSEVLRNIADTLNSPMKKTGEEWQIIYDYKILKSGCPKSSDKIYLLNIMKYIDIVANKIISLFPDLVPLMILQNIIPPVLKSIADSMDGKQIDADLIIEINNQLLTLPILFASSLDLHGRNMLTKEKNGVMKNIIPEKIKIRDGDAYLMFSGGVFKMMKDSDGVYIYDIDHKSLQLSKKHMIYKRSNRKWVTTKSEQITLSEAENVESIFGKK
ncbi:hypothetical protein [Erwinia tasmaniensis]|uniref:Uncharacterized protein n=1 Tax=Erwinia tasmaniensis (strain DSM 17950 / CFBP 7177 / CIP 109463 / NCPPB 4357 / Et1/99) TaxID=465817 RepID=B2VFD3_ERWT9|nr:hypothetical protein [Erwinia tasmaniensis]CAO95055.1 hypothetical protein ETA_00090 [Erwinia tasmaniensis Et1/99]